MDDKEVKSDYILLVYAKDKVKARFKWEAGELPKGDLAKLLKAYRTKDSHMFALWRGQEALHQGDLASMRGYAGVGETRGRKPKAESDKKGDIVSLRIPAALKAELEFEASLVDISLSELILGALAKR